MLAVCMRTQLTTSLKLLFCVRPRCLYHIIHMNIYWICRRRQKGEACIFTEITINNTEPARRRTCHKWSIPPEQYKPETSANQPEPRRFLANLPSHTPLGHVTCVWLIRLTSAFYACSWVLHQTIFVLVVVCVLLLIWRASNGEVYHYPKMQNNNRQATKKINSDLHTSNEREDFEAEHWKIFNETRWWPLYIH